MSGRNMVIITSDDQFQQKKNQTRDKLMVIDFHAEWCNPCKTIAPKFSQLALNNPHVEFWKIDVDKCPQTAQEYGVTKMPTFLFLHNFVVKDTLHGANQDMLEMKLSQLKKDEVSNKESGVVIPGMVDLEQFIVEKNCLNESEDRPFKWVFEENKELYLESDCDPELLMSFSFNQVVKLHSIKCVGPCNGKAPKTLKLFINLPHAMDFDSARDASPLQEIKLTEEEVAEGNPVELKYVKFQNVNNITIFIPDNQGDEETTVVERIVFYGKTVNTTNMKDFQRVAGKKGESH